MSTSATYAFTAWAYGIQIRLDNPRWAAFMNTLVVEVCQTLGVHYEKSQPRYELYKLLLYETGSHFLPHQE